MYKSLLKAYKDKIPGGLADNKQPSEFDQKALKEGVSVEKEHTSNPAVAKEIAMDHLTEDKKYYKKLATIENKKPLNKAPAEYFPHPSGNFTTGKAKDLIIPREERGFTEKRKVHMLPNGLRYEHETDTNSYGEVTHNHFLFHPDHKDPVAAIETYPHETREVNSAVGSSNEGDHQVKASKVDAEHTGKGYGKMLYSAVLKHFVPQGNKLWSDKQVSRNAQKVWSGFKGKSGVSGYIGKYPAAGTDGYGNGETEYEDYPNYVQVKDKKKFKDQEHFPVKAKPQMFSDKKKLAASEMQKGAMRRLAPFKPTDLPMDTRENMEEWQENQPVDARDSLSSEGMDPNAKMRALHKLSAKTAVRKDKNGKREFLLHRGMDRNEFVHNRDVVNPTRMNHDDPTSWTPDLSIAHQFKSLYGDDMPKYDSKGSKGRTEAKPAGIVSAWVNEDHITFVPKQYGYVDEYSDKNIGSKNKFASEHEIIVSGKHNSEMVHKNHLPNLIGQNKDNPKGFAAPTSIDRQINRRAESVRGPTTNEGVTQEYAQVRGRAKKSELEKSNYGPKGGGQYTQADNVRRKQSNANEVITAPGNVKVKTGANASGGQGKQKLNQEMKELARKNKKQPIHRPTITPEEAAKYLASANKLKKSVKSPSKHIPLHRLKQIQRDNYIGEGGKEYSAEEIHHAINERSQTKGQKLARIKHPEPESNKNRADYSWMFHDKKRLAKSTKIIPIKKPVDPVLDPKRPQQPTNPKYAEKAKLWLENKNKVKKSEKHPGEYEYKVLSHPYKKGGGLDIAEGTPMHTVKAYHNGDYVGHVTAMHDQNNHLVIGDAALDDKHMNRGVGRGMYEALYQHAASKGATHISTSFPSEDAARVHASIAKKYGLQFNPEKPNNTYKNPFSKMEKNEKADIESELIKENKKNPNNQKPHKFKAANWTHPNGHPRCILCGDEERIGGQCSGAKS